MRAAKWTFGMLFLFIGAFHLSGKDDEAIDLRGPAPKKGEVSISTTVFKINKADLSIGKIEVKQTLTSTEEEELRVIAVEDRQATKVQTKVIKQKLDSITTFNGEDTEKSDPGELQGEVIISERTKDGKWKHSLVDSKPNDKQKKELDKRIGPENDDELFPAEKVKVGHTWTVDASALQRVFGGSITELKGKLKMKFVKFEKINGEQCAVIESSGVIKGIAKEDEGDLDVEMDMKGTTWRTVKTGLDVKDKASGTIKMSGKITMDGVKADLTLEGPFSIESTSKLKATKE